MEFNFECKTCTEYEPSGTRKRGTCKLTSEKVAKTFSCRQNPKQLEFLDYMFGK